MANQVSETLRISIDNDELRDSFTPATVTYTQTTKGLKSEILIVPTTGVTFDPGDITTPGALCWQNLDDTNFVQVGPDNAGSLVALSKTRPGRFGKIDLDTGVTIRLVADTASCRVKLWLLEV